MANHVNTHISFQINDAAKEYLKELIARMDEHKTLYSILTEEEWTWEEQSDLVGPKWCFVEDHDEDSIALMSAWAQPTQGIENLMTLLMTVDENAKCYVTYEDEMPNFFGAYALEGIEIIDENEWDYDELVAHMESTIPELKGKWNEEEQEWSTDEASDIFSDFMYESISELQSTVELTT